MPRHDRMRMEPLPQSSVRAATAGRAAAAGTAATAIATGSATTSLAGAGAALADSPGSGAVTTPGAGPPASTGVAAASARLGCTTASGSATRRERRRRHRAAAAGPCPLHVRIEDGQQATLDLRAPGHRPGGERRAAGVLQRAGDVEQVVGVLRRALAGGEHHVVAGALALGPHPPHGHPDERVEPEGGGRELRDHVSECVEARHVSQLVEQHQPPPLRAPRHRVARKQHHRVHHAPGHRHRPPLAEQQRHRPPHAELAGEPLDEQVPLRVEHGLGAPRQPVHAERADEQPRQHQGDAQRVRQPEQHRWSRRPHGAESVARARRRAE